MIVLRTLAGLVKLLNSETSSRAIALALGLGMILGFVPILSLQAFVVISILLFFRVHVSAALLSFGLFKIAAWFLAGTLDSIGVTLVEIPPLTPFWAWLYNAPLLTMLGTNQATTVGGTVVALALFAPLFIVSRKVVDLYRARFEKWWVSVPLINTFRASSLYQFYQWLDSPF